jgi:TonB-linked SusC/RagA family outer membrane protein
MLEEWGGGALLAFVLSLLFVLSLGVVPASLAQETGIIEGTVTSDATGDPIPGVNVLVEGTDLGAATGADGTYQVPGVEPGTYTVRATFVGYGDETEQGVEINEGETTTVDIAMQQEATSLDEVVVVGYGEQQQRDVTGAISSVSSEELESASPQSVDEALQGRVAGVQVTTNSSKPGGGISVRIRGTGSITSGSEPLYVIDGVPVYNDTNTPGTPSSRVGPNPLATINPQSIESIEVLKDASATAIYGARGSNGVVLITTKQGEGERSTVSFSSSLGTENPVEGYDLLNPRQYVELASEAMAFQGEANDLQDPSAYSAEDPNFTDEVYRGTPLVQNYRVSVRGGDESTQYAVSGDYFDRRGIVKNSGFKRYSFRVNLDQDVTDRFRLEANLSGNRGEYALVTGEQDGSVLNLPGAALQFIPIFSLRNEDGNYTDHESAAPGYSARRLENPIAAYREESDDTKINRFLGSATAEFDLLENLYVQAELGADIEDYTREKYNTAELIRANQNSAQTLRRSRFNLLGEGLLKYNATHADVHNVDATAGFTWQQETTEFESISNSQFLTDITRNDDLGAGTEPGGPSVGSGRAEWTLLSWLGRVNYSYDDRYLVTLTGRYDGSSKFGAGNKWGFFPSGAVAWRAIEEPFMQEQDLFSNLKLRASYGLTGNQEIGTYSSLSGLNTDAYAFGGTEVLGFIPRSLANPQLKWETARQLDIGVDLGFFDQRLRVTADYYRKNTEDLILPVTLPFASGFRSATQNVGSMRNTGIELSLAADVLTGEVFSWSTNANFAANDNEVTDLGEGERFFGPDIFITHGALVEEGKPIGVFFGYEADGIFADEAAVEEAGYGEVGGIRYVDQNDDGQISPEDRTVLGNPAPDFTYGWTNTFTFAGLELSAFLSGQYGNEVFNLQSSQFTRSDVSSNSIVERFEGRWTEENPEGATYPRAGFTGYRDSPEDGRLVEDGSYLRLQSLTLGYNLPVGRLGSAVGGAVQSARLYVQGRNLFTITGYSGFDPDVNSRGQGSINRGYDIGSYPLTRTYTVGLDLTF